MKMTDNITTELRPCIECGTEYERKTLHIEGMQFAVQRCGQCLNRQTAETIASKSRDKSTTVAANWIRICPDDYRNTDQTDPRLHQDALRACLEWSPNSMRGLGIIGTTGAGKTRCLFLALKRAHDAGMKCEAISHNRFSKTVQDAFSGERMDKGDARQILENLRRADVILFDDLGKPPSTERADSELEELLEHRTSHRKPTLWSANGGGRWIIQRLGPDRGAPLVRRLAEQGDVITVRK